MRRHVLSATSPTWFSKLCVIAATVAFLATALIASVATATSAGASTRSFPSGPGNPGIFTERCKFSHQAANDPIMMPRMPGMAMHHDFFGNVTTNAFSTAASLRGRRTSCSTPADSSGYWIPVLYQHGRALRPRSALLYWRRPMHDHHPIHSMPRGLQIVAGNAMAKRPTGHVGWSCVGGGATAASKRGTGWPHGCPRGSRVKETVAFPNCWDGHTLSAKNRTNVAYLVSNKKGCPRSHPVQIPQILFHVIYPTRSASGIRLSLTPHRTASAASAHADFINGWRQGLLDRDVRICLATSTRCGGVHGPGANPHGPSPRELAKLRAHQAMRNRH